MIPISLLLFSLSAGQASALPPTDTVFGARVERLLSDGRLKQARTLLDSALRTRPNDVQLLTLLARVHLEWPVVGRWEALRLLRRAAAANPRDPEPWYWRARVGVYLAGADGEAIIRSGLHGTWRREPTYRDTWEMWRAIHHSPSDLLRAAAILERHAGVGAADIRRAQLLVQAEHYAEAEAILATAVGGGRDDAAVWALRAQGALETGDTATGLSHYWRAIARAASDSLDILWRQVEPIAAPEEEAEYATMPPELKQWFFRAFWARREPDLTTPTNERIVEHFARLRHARDHYRLLHPQSVFHRSPARRTLAAGAAARVLEALRGFTITTGPIPGRSRFEEEIQAAGLGVDVRDIPEPDSLTRYRRLGFDGRGLMYLRFGEPLRRWIDHERDVEAWEYLVDGTPVSLTFARASAELGGDMILFPTSLMELHNSAIMLEEDETSLEADLTLKAWVADFRGPERDEHLVYIGTNVDTIAVAAWDATWTEVGRVHGPSPLVLTLLSGRYRLGIDGRSGTRLARLRTDYDVESLWRRRVTLSSLLVGMLPDTGFTRDDVARSMPADLTFPQGVPLSLFAEIYDLPADRQGRSVYEVRYTFEPEDGGAPISFAFDRTTLGARTTIERIVLQPDRVPPGRYRLSLGVRDRVTGRRGRSTNVRIEIR